VLTADLYVGAVRADRVLSRHGCRRCGTTPALTQISAGLESLFRSFAGKASADAR
jgi:hypothetical protein